jgi:drug/metabolite transporter (DMT)-like permease
MNRTALAALLTMFAMLCFAGMDAISKWLVADYAVTQMMWIRSALFLGFTWFVVRRQGLRSALNSKWPKLQLLRSIVAVIEGAVFVLAFRYLPLADTHALAATSPLIVIVLGTIWLGEQANLPRVLAVIGGFAGVLLIVRPGFRDFDWPLALPLAGAFLWALYQILTRLCSREDSPNTSLAWAALVAFVMTSFVGPLEWRWPGPLAWTLMIVISLMGAAAHYALIKALDFAEAGAVQPYAYSMLVWATALGFLVFSQMPDGWTITGATIVVLCGIYAWRHDQRAARAAIVARQ